MKKAIAIILDEIAKCEKEKAQITPQKYPILYSHLTSRIDTLKDVCRILETKRVKSVSSATKNNQTDHPHHTI